jgi:transcriptional regulator with XRE-family HTH domain
VRLRRSELGLTQANLASRLGISFQQVQKYEKGSNCISASRLEATAKVLGVPISYFFSDPTSGASPEAQAEAAFAAVQTGRLT